MRFAGIALSITTSSGSPSRVLSVADLLFCVSPLPTEPEADANAETPNSAPDTNPFFKKSFLSILLVF
jgi:hypothetical protein